MYLERIKLKNIRGCAALDVNLVGKRARPAGWTVLAGRNGTGKTTLLQAAAATVIGPDNVLVMLERPDELVRLGENEGRSDVWLTGADEDWRDPKDERGSVHLGVSWGRGQGVTKHPPKGNHVFVENQLWGGAAFGAQPRGWCFAAYGAQRLATPATSTAEQLMAAPPRRSAVVSVFRRDASLMAAHAWARELSRHPRGTSESAPPPYSPTLALLHALLNDGLLSDEGAGIRITLGEAGILVHRHEQALPLSSLGQGFESLALLVIDIVRQMCAFFGENMFAPDAPVWLAGVPVRVNHSGVVLIDEIENHLHPALQQRVGFWLKEHFPNVQFIVTTHSPFICQAADEGGLFRVAQAGSVELVSTDVFRRVVNGSADDAVVTELFGLPHAFSPRSHDLREELARIESRMLAGDTLPPAVAERREELVGELPSDTNTEVDRLYEALRRRP